MSEIEYNNDPDNPCWDRTTLSETDIEFINSLTPDENDQSAEYVRWLQLYHKQKDETAEWREKYFQLEQAIKKTPQIPMINNFQEFIELRLAGKNPQLETPDVISILNNDKKHTFGDFDTIEDSTLIAINECARELYEATVRTMSTRKIKIKREENQRFQEDSKQFQERELREKAERKEKREATPVKYMSEKEKFIHSMTVKNNQTLEVAELQWESIMKIRASKGK